MSASSARAVLLAVALWAAPSVADDGGSSGGGGRCSGCLIGFGITVGVIDLAYLIVDISTLATGWTYLPGWSVLEILYGVGQLALGLIVTPLEAIGVARGVAEAGGGLAAGIIFVVMGIWCIVHGIVDLKRYFVWLRDEREARERRGGLASLIPSLSAGAGPHGGTARLTWKF